MNYKEFFAWCRARERDGRWDYGTKQICRMLLGDIKKHPIWFRKRRFDRLNRMYGVSELMARVNQTVGEGRAQ